MGILISSLYTNVVLANVCVSLNLDDAIVENWLILDVEKVIFRYFAPRIPKIVEMQRSTR